MPLRSRLRRAFTRGAHDDPQVVKGKKSKNYDPNVYQPGEKMPPLKYRRPVAPEHKAHLESFDWAKAWRRKSTASIYSPMGSRMPSRKSSFSSFRTRRSVRSVHGRRSQSKPRRADDYRENDSGIGASLSGDHQLIEDSDDEGDITNVGLSRNPTEDPKRPRKSSVSSNGSRPPTADRTRRPSAATETPFDPEDLEAALQKTTLDTTQEESERSGTISPPNPSDALTEPVQTLPEPDHGPEFYDRLRPRERLIAFDDDHTFESISDPPRAGTY
ncbi:uncharacterized protein CC84DRAFT_1167138 [Paraphaeosphaeria sporulosa]|uniref:Uncharacterized protein n=1 Tax=Paraphaeosphaeria sporulosa TaxID=1460663 RepID=A0A177C3J6_9PLEO|nr:uncharacterized protein CC84DRAFT_1167138 [Paraphaeosphaeria sporulosa]OAG01976.1 hypothetical protein CC84DRAFT_1167138 [Paraphaeosphaeria sporulosa]